MESLVWSDQQSAPVSSSTPCPTFPFLFKNSWDLELAICQELGAILNLQGSKKSALSCTALKPSVRKTFVTLSLTDYWSQINQFETLNPRKCKLLLHDFIRHLQKYIAIFKNHALVTHSTTSRLSSKKIRDGLDLSFY